MSLPTPSSGSTMDPRLLQEMERPMIELAQKSGGDLRRLLYAFFSFLHRRTDFYCIVDDEPTAMGFREGDAEKLLLAAFRQFPLRKVTASGNRAKSSGPSPSVSSSSKEARRTGNTETTAVKKASSTQKTPPKEPSTKERSVTASDADKASESSDKPSLTEEGLQVPEGNGGVTARYRWTQTLEEVTVVVAVPEGTRGKDMSVTLKQQSASVKLKKPPNDSDGGVLLDGILVHKIDTEESTWSLESGVLLLLLQKRKPLTWWDTVLEGDERIDTSMVDSRRHIDSYDESTQGAIRKILFDQRQQRLGLPTSDEIIRTQGGDALPPMPPGVEYIDKETLDRNDSKSET